MRNFLLGLSFSLVFVAGCVAAQFIVPPVRAGTTPQKWEYICLGGGPGEQVNEELMKTFNDSGAQGWEMFASWNANCFKRPLP